MGKNYRQGRLGEEIKKSISGYLLNGIKDPRLSTRIITISAVEVSSDGSYATVFFTPLTLSGEDSNEVSKEVLSEFFRVKSIFLTILSVHSPFKCLSLQKIEGNVPNTFLRKIEIDS